MNTHAIIIVQCILCCFERIYIYIYIYVCVCVCVLTENSWTKKWLNTTLELKRCLTLTTESMHQWLKHLCHLSYLYVCQYTDTSKLFSEMLYRECGPRSHISFTIWSCNINHKGGTLRRCFDQESGITCNVTSLKRLKFWRQWMYMPSTHDIIGDRVQDVLLR